MRARHPVGSIATAQQNGHQRTRQVAEQISEPHAFKGQFLWGDAMHRADRADDIGTGGAVMRRHHHQIDLVARKMRVLDLDPEGAAATRPLHRQRGSHGIASAADENIGPRRLEPVAIIAERGQRSQPELRWQASPRRAHGKPLFDHRQIEGLGQSHDLTSHPGLAIVKRPDNRRVRHVSLVSGLGKDGWLCKMCRPVHPLQYNCVRGRGVARTLPEDCRSARPCPPPRRSIDQRD